LRHSPLGVAAGTLLCDAVWAAFWLWAAVEGVAWARRVPVAAAVALAAVALVAVLSVRARNRGRGR
ncbi:MAG: hypothetical protein AB1503_12425, partial [Bacillota bacterium]